MFELLLIGLGIPAMVLGATWFCQVWNEVLSIIIDPAFSRFRTRCLLASFLRLRLVQHNKFHGSYIDRAFACDSPRKVSFMALVFLQAEVLMCYEVSFVQVDVINKSLASSIKKKKGKGTIITSTFLCVFVVVFCSYI